MSEDKNKKDFYDGKIGKKFSNQFNKIKKDLESNGSVFFRNSANGNNHQNSNIVPKQNPQLNNFHQKNNSSASTNPFPSQIPNNQFSQNNNSNSYPINQNNFQANQNSANPVPKTINEEIGINIANKLNTNQTNQPNNLNYDSTNNKQMKNNKNQKRSFDSKSILSTLFKVGISVAAIGVLIGMAVFFTYASQSPNISEAQLMSTNSTQLLDSQNNVFYSISKEDRDYADQSEIPTKLKHAVVAIEDKRFYKHHGIDLYRTIGAAISSIRYKLHLGGDLEGGSTLTQQLVKLSVFSTSASDQTLKRKAQEAWLAMKVERNFSKDQILTFYINKVNLGSVYGMKTAAKYFFNKNLNELTDSQYAILAGIPNAPNYYNPYTNPEAVTQRRNAVINAELSVGYLTKEEAKKAIDTPISDGLVQDGKDNNGDKNSSTAIKDDSYIQSVLKEVQALGYDPYKSGLKIYTNLNQGFQDKIVDTLNSDNIFAAGSQAAATLINPNNGKVLAQVGGRNINGMFSLNRATQTNRSSGSSIKPILDYAPAVEYLNWPTFFNINDKKINYPGTDIEVSNYDGKYHGTVTMRSALVNSFNTPAVQAFDAVGATKAGQFIDKLGFNTQNNPLYTSSSIGYNVSTVQMSAAFSAFSNGGTYYKPQYVSKIMTSDGETHSYDNPGQRAMKDSTAYIMTNMLKGVPSPTGSGPSAYIPGLNQAGKTGIVGYADGLQPEGVSSDIWFAGYTKNYALTIWNGFDEPNKPGNYIDRSEESTPAERAWATIIGAIIQGQSNPDWTMPASVQSTLKKGVTEYVVKGATWDNLPGVSDDSTKSTNKPANPNSSASSSSSTAAESSPPNQPETPNNAESSASTPETEQPPTTP
jgi:penicillin-binding protein 1A